MENEYAFYCHSAYTHIHARHTRNSQSVRSVHNEVTEKVPSNFTYDIRRTYNLLYWCRSVHPRRLYALTRKVIPYNTVRHFIYLYVKWMPKIMIIMRISRKRIAIKIQKRRSDETIYVSIQPRPFEVTVKWWFFFSFMHLKSRTPFYISYSLCSNLILHSECIYSISSIFFHDFANYLTACIILCIFGYTRTQLCLIKYNG